MIKFSVLIIITENWYIPAVLKFAFPTSVQSDHDLFCLCLWGVHVNRFMQIKVNVKSWEMLLLSKIITNLKKKISLFYADTIYHQYLHNTVLYMGVLFDV